MTKKSEIEALVASELPDQNKREITPPRLRSVFLGFVDRAVLQDQQIASGNVPDLDAAKITSGTLADARLPTSQAGKTFTSPVQHADGTASSPSITFASDTDTGMFRPGANTLAFTMGGSERMRLTSTGLGIGTSSPGAQLDVNGDALIHGVSVGRGAGANFTNTAVGLNVLLNNTTGGLNTALGINALSNNTTGNNNTGVGVSALFHNTTGSDNTAVGLFALLNNTTGTRNIALGRDAGNAAVGDNNTIIGSITGTTGMSDTVIIAAGTTERLRIDSSGNVLIGTTSSGASRLRVVGLPTSASGLSSGDVWRDGDTLKIVP